MAKLGNLKIIEQDIGNDPSGKDGAAPDDLARLISEAAVYVHKTLGPGLDRGVYKECLMEDLRYRGLHVEVDVSVPVSFRGKDIEHGFFMDLLVEKQVVICVRAEVKDTDLHKMQLMSAMRLSGMRLGYLVNFQVSSMKSGLLKAVANTDVVSRQAKSSLN